MLSRLLGSPRPGRHSEDGLVHASARPRRGWAPAHLQRVDRGRGV